MTPLARAAAERAGIIAVVAAIWIGTAELSVSSVLLTHEAMHVWVPAGVALGIAVLAGEWTTLGVGLGTLVFLTGHRTPPGLAALLALIGAVNIAFGAYVLRRVAHVHPALDRVRDVIALVITAAGISFVGSCAEISAQLAFPLEPYRRVLAHGPGWLWSHLTAELVLTPLILTFASRPARARDARSWVEPAFLAVAVLVVSVIVFDVRISARLPLWPRPFYLFPLLVWTGLRYNTRAAAAATAAVATAAFGSWMLGVGPYEQLAQYQGFVMVAGVTTLVLAALRTEQVRAVVRKARIQETALDAIVTVDSRGTIVEWNPAAVAVFGFRSDEAIGREAAGLLVPAAERTRLRDGIAWYSRRGADSWVDGRVCYPLLRAGGQEFPAEIALTRSQGDGEIWFTAFVRDITAASAAEAARRESRELLERKVSERTAALSAANDELKHRDELLREAQALAHVGSFDYERGEDHLDWSDEIARIIGRDPATFTRTAAELEECIHPEDRARARAAVEQAVASRQPYRLEARIVRPDGSVATVVSEGRVYADDKGQVSRVAGYVQDVTDQKLAEQRILQSLNEKEILLREIHHRVKNNLQVITSLLNLQVERVASPDARSALRESQDRIRSMAFVHELLYRSKDFAHIDFLDYLRSVVDSLMRSYRSDQRSVSGSVTGVPIQLDIDRASSCGLIVTELVTNALRHAFPPGRSGHIAVRVGVCDEQIVLSVSDDGIGPRGRANLEAVSTFGLQIARALTQQLDGTIEIDTSVGTAVEIRFPQAVRGERVSS